MAANWPGRMLSTSFRTIVLIELCILLLSCYNVDSSNDLNCFSERFDSTERSNISINGQEELDKFVDNVTADNLMDRCVQLFLTEKAYELDIIKIMGMKLGTGGGLVMVGLANPRVTIKCIANVSGLEELRSILKPLANTSLVVLDGLTFVGCPVPIVLEQVKAVIVQNCHFT